MIPTLLSSGGGYTLPFVGPGTYLIFGIVLAPIYVMIAAWFLGRPRDPKKALLGVTYLAGLTVSLWGSLFVVTMLIKFVFW
ncbi:hypothetical protein ACKVMT_14150 [Halobacteriales archaeon Cl-PHB]